MSEAAGTRAATIAAVKTHCGDTFLPRMDRTAAFRAPSPLIVLFSVFFFHRTYVHFDRWHDRIFLFTFFDNRVSNTSDLTTNTVVQTLFARFRDYKS